MFFRRLNWNVVGWLKTVSIISYAIIALGIASMIYHWATTGTPLRLGLSFTGGTDVTAKFVRPVTQDAIAKALAEAGAQAGSEIIIGEGPAAVIFDWDPEIRAGGSHGRGFGPRGTDRRLAP